MPISSFEISQFIAQQHQATMGLLSGGGYPQPGMGPTGLEGISEMGDPTGARAISGLGGTVIPAAAAGLGIATRMDPFSLTMGAFKRGAGITGSLMSRAGLLGAAPAGGGAAVGGLAQAGIGGIARGLAFGLPVAGAAIAAGQAFNYGVGQMTVGAARRSRLENYLGTQFGFRGGQARGMNVDEVSQISAELAGLARDLDRGVNEVTRNLATIRGLGVMRKVGDVREFRQRMRETMQALDTLGREFRVSMEQAGDYLARMRRAGFRGIADQMAMITPLRQAQWATGMTRTQVQAVMQQGTMLARAVGGQGWRGAVGAQRALVGIGAAERAGIINEGMLEEATGATGAEAYGAFAGVSQMAMARRLSSRFGRYFLAAGATEDMRRLDPQRMRGLLSGAYSMGDIQRMARQSVYGPGRRGMEGRFLMYEEEMRGQMMQMGPRALAGMVRAEMGERVHDYEDPRVNRMVRQAYGLTKRQAEIVLRMARRMPEMLAEEMRQEEMRLSQQATGGRTASGVQRLKANIGRTIRRYINEPLQEVGEGIAVTVNEMASSIDRAVFGGQAPRRPQVRISRAAASMFARMGQGGNRGLMEAIQQLRPAGGYETAMLSQAAYARAQESVIEGGRETRPVTQGQLLSILGGEGPVERSWDWIKRQVLLPAVGGTVGGGMARVAGRGARLRREAEQAGEVRDLFGGTAGTLIMQGLTGSEREKAEALRKLEELAGRRDATPTLKAAVAVVRTGSEQQKQQLLRTGVQQFYGPEMEQYRETVRGRMGRMELGTQQRSELAALGLGGVTTELTEGRYGLGAGRGAGMAGLAGFYKEYGAETRLPERAAKLEEFFGRFAGLSREKQARAMQVFEGTGYAGGEFRAGMAAVARVTRAMRGRKWEPTKGPITGERLMRTLKALGGGEIDLQKEDLKKLSGMSVTEIQKKMNLSRAGAEEIKRAYDDRKFTAEELRKIAAKEGTRIAQQSVLGAGAADLYAKEMGEAKGFGTGRGLNAELQKQTLLLKTIALHAAENSSAAKKLLGEIDKVKPGRKDSKSAPAKGGT